MAVQYPTAMPKLTDEEFSVERPVSMIAARKLAQAVNMMGQLCMIGQVKAFALNQPGVAAPSATIFDYADGHEITNPTSPLRTVGAQHNFTPDMRSRFVRGSDGSTNLGNEAGGSATVNLSHAHTLGGVDPARGADGEEGDELVSGQEHSHGVNADLSTTEALDPAHLEVAFFIKVN